MWVRRVHLTNVRCHKELELEFGRRLTVLVGVNGAGKTSVLEAVHLLLRGNSPRTAQTRDLVSHGESVLRVEAELAPSGGMAALGYSVDGERRLTLDGTPLRDPSRFEESVPVRMFVPDDLRLVKGSPRRRRQYLDALAAALWPPYHQAYGRYEEALRQRNTLLRTGVVGGEHAPWEALLAREGLTLVHARARSLREMTAHYARTHATLAGDGIGPTALSYRTNVAELDEPAYREALASQRGADRQRTFTHVGPHRDDVRFLLEGRDLREFGSQGEQRTAVLASVLGERVWLQEAGGIVPVLLLDDVMSELDEDRRRALMSMLVTEGQVVVTTTDLHYFAPEELQQATVVHVRRTGGRS